MEVGPIRAVDRGRVTKGVCSNDEVLCTDSSVDDATAGAAMGADVVFCARIDAAVVPVDTDEKDSLRPELRL